MTLKTFRLVRTEDVSGVSGTGTVAMGVVFPDGTPVKGSWTEAEYIGDNHGMRDVYYFDGTPTHRYFETEWEEIPNA